MALSTVNDEIRAVGSAAYWGDRREWGIALTQHRDSGCLDRANFQAMRALLNAADEGGETWAVESMGHWAVGWVEYLLVAPNSAAWDVAQKARKDLENYPVLDEEKLSEIEYEEFLKACEMALADYGYRRMFSDEELPEVATYVFSVAGEQADDPENWYPERDGVFWGVIAYRRSKRSK